ncbi:hypothetical protein MNV49_004428 [Pseudohyphozyma bogoriensis]|nr:hypothetical protein MNV49_004428 [Pseudohyphozyma bogoriensis]
MFRPILRQAARVPRTAVRNSSTTAAHSGEVAIEGSGLEFVKEREAVKHHAAKSGELWRKITIYVAFPTIIAGYLNAKSMMTEHEHHVAHIKEENGGELPPRVVYPYFNIRTKDYPWGPHTLFYNPHVNIDSEASDE